MPLAIAIAVQLAVIVVLTATAWAAGRVVLRLARADSAGVALAIAAGSMLIAQAALLLGLAGRLDLPWVIGVGVAVHVAARAEWRAALAAAARPGPALGRARAWTGLLIAIAAVPVFALTLYPPLGFDQTLYHLPMARGFAATGGLPFLEAIRFPVFPALAEVTHAVVLLAARVEATQAASLVAYAACIGLAWRWAREASTPAGAWLAAGILAGSPIGWYLAATGYVEPTLALFGLAALYAAERSRDEPGIASLVLAGLFAGSAASVKYHGVYFVAAAAALALPSEQRLIDWRRLGLYGLAAAAALAPTYLRLLAHTGNPVFPFLPHVFGDSAWAPPPSFGRSGFDHVSAAATLAWDMTFRRERVGLLPPYSPAFVLGVPIALAAAWLVPRLRRLAALTAAYVALAPVHAHYVMAIAPLWAVVVGASAARLVEGSRAWTRGLVVVALCTAAAGDAYVLHRLRRLGWPPVTAAQRDVLLAAERPLHPAVARLNRIAPGATVYGVGAEDMLDYLDGRLLGDFNGPVSHARIEARVHAAGSLAPVLDDIGAGWLLVREGASPWIDWAESDARLSVVYRDAAARVYRVGPAAADRGRGGRAAPPFAPDSDARR